MELLGPALIGLASAFLVAAVALGVAGLAGRRSEAATVPHWGPALALGAGYIAGHVAMARPAFPPVEVTDRIPWLALAASVLGLLESARPTPGWARWENRLLLTAVVLGAVLGPVLGTELYDGRAGAVRLIGLGVGVLASWASLEALARRTTAAALGPALLAVSSGAGAALVLSGSLSLGQFAGCLTAAMAATWSASLWATRLSFRRGGAPVVVAVLSALLLVGHTYSSLPGSSAGLLAAAPAAAWAGRLGPLAPWKGALVGFIAVLVPVGLALWLAVPASSGEGY